MKQRKKGFFKQSFLKKRSNNYVSVTKDSQA